MKTLTLSGITASPGVARGNAVVFTRADLPEIEGPAAGVDMELARLHEAIDSSVGELTRLRESTHATLGDSYAHIFRSQQTMVEDASIIAEVEEIIRSQEVCAESALRTVFEGYRSLFDELDEADYNKGRVADIDDVYKRVVRNLVGVAEVSLADIRMDSIVVAKELLPSDTAVLDPSRIRGLVTERGGPTAHVAILAKNLGIPAVVRVAGAVGSIRDRDFLMIDGIDGSGAQVFVNPEEDTVRVVGCKEHRFRTHKSRVEAYRKQEPVTKDGVKVDISVNVGSTVELEPAARSGARSIGLYRSEFLFLNAAELPDEDAQYIAYRRASEAFRSGTVVIRTLDIGGDKPLPVIRGAAEQNPFLGNRAIRFCLSQPDLFRTQLRAILRASASGNVKLMFPMIGGLPELDAALGMVEHVKEELATEGASFDSDIEVGVMIEVPSAVWVADALARRVSFFSIGTNDLTQYLMAADRLNGEIGEYYRSFDPSVFRAIRAVAEAGERYGRSVSVCGELGGNPIAIPALLGLGVRALSMSPSLVPEAIWRVRSIAMSDAGRLADRVLALDSHTEIQALLGQYYASKE